MISGRDIRKKYLKFFESKGHVIIPSAPLVPENDPTTLFTGSGMQPMLPYLLGQSHPLGTRLVDSQKCFRSQDIEEVGDNCHDTFFEMLGNWSLGDYFKEEQIAWFWEFLTVELKLPQEKLYVSVFDEDKETAEIWKKLGVPTERIYFYGEEKNWWSRSGIRKNMPVGEPGGPDSEVFFDFGGEAHKDCHPNCDCGRFMEIGNNVFMTYKKTNDGFVPLEKKNIDFGGGLERITAAANNNPDVYKTDLFMPIIKVLGGEVNVTTRVIADHIKASVFLIQDGVMPGNKAQGYFLRRLLRRSSVKMQQLGLPLEFTEIIKAVFGIYPMYLKDFDLVNRAIEEEISKFKKTLDLGLKMVGKVSNFDLYQSYGFPKEVIKELCGDKFDEEEFEKEKSKHQDLSRTAGKGMFKGGLQDHSETTTRYHTATHLLHAALRKVLGNSVSQKGSNITAERLRFDFSFDRKLTESEIKDVEDLVNQKIGEDLVVERLEMQKSKALEMGAMAFFPEKYPELTSVYKIGDFSLELCGGPHVASTGAIGKFKIDKEESAGSGVRRVYATALFP
ncbi:MAG: alanine--tRNA ligase [Patescibacteria group bacterium]